MELVVSAVTSPPSLSSLHLCCCLLVKADSKGEPSLSFACLLCVLSCRDEFCGLQCEFCSGSASRDPAIALRGRRQKPVYPSVVPFRSYSSLNLQQVLNCDFYLHSPSGSSSSKPQTTTQIGNHLLKHSRLYITGTVTRQWRHARPQQILPPPFRKAKKKTPDGGIYVFCNFFFLPSFPFFPSVFGISQKPWSDLGSNASFVALQKNALL